MNEINISQLANNIIANIILGESGSFMPSGLMQWVILFIFIFVGVILVRKIFDMDKNYHKKPMKHK